VLRFSKKKYPYILLLPVIAMLIFLTVVPLGFLGFLSFVSLRYGFPLSNASFAGIETFQWVLGGGDKEFWYSFKVTSLYAALTVLFEMPLGFGIAMLLNRRLIGEKIIKTILILPITVVPIVMGMFWKMMLNYDYGIYSYFIQLFGIHINWFSADNALWTLILVDIWASVPFLALAILSALQALPKLPFEAAKVDGASKSQIFRYITFPSVAPVLYVVLSLKLIGAIGAYGVPFIVTGGGPGYSTEVLSLHIQRIFLGRMFMGKGATVATCLVLLTLVVVATFIKLTNYGAEEKER